MLNELISSLLIVDCEVRRRTLRARADDAKARQLREAMRTVSRGVLAGAASPPAGERPDPELIVQGYLAAAGDWHALAAAVNRHGLDAQSRRIP
jgi:hypothetical protein